MPTLIVRPTLTGLPIDDGKTFIWQILPEIYQNHQQEIILALQDIAKVIKCTEAEIQFSLPDGDEETMQKLLDALPKNIQTHIEKLTVNPKEQNYNICCIDKALQHFGHLYHAQLGQITHSGGALFLDPELNLPEFDHHKKILNATVDAMIKHGNKIGSIDHHFGYNGFNGCAMFANLPQELKTKMCDMENLIDMLKRVRLMLSKKNVLANECLLTGTAISIDGSRRIFNLEDPAQVAELQQLPDLKI